MSASARHAADLNPARFGLAIALLAAALLRFWALGQGVPFSVQVDEPEVMLRAVRMIKTGDLNPHFFDYPTLYMYVQALGAVLRFLVGAMQGKWASLADAPPEAFYLWGRTITAIIGTATVWVVYRTGMRWGRRTALLAAAMFAVMPLHVRESHFVLTDTPATFLVMLTLLLSLRAHERSTVAAFVVAGAAAGLAAATKYNAALAGAIPLVAAAATPGLRPSRSMAALAVVGGMIAAFLIAAPYSFLDLPTFLNQFARLSSEYRGAVPSEPPARTYLKHLRNALEWPGSIIVLSGIGLGLWRAIIGPQRLKWALAVLFPLFYFRFISQQNIVFARYLLPMLPFLSLLGAAAIVAAVEQAKRLQLPHVVCNGLIVLLVLASIAPPAYTSMTFNATAAKVWTTEQAYSWILKQIPPGAKITMESRGILLPAAYRIQYVPQLRLHALETYAAENVDYLIASSQCYGPYLDPQNGGPSVYPSEYGDYMRIFRQTQEVARFIPSREHPGPELRILKIAKAAP